MVWLFTTQTYPWNSFQRYKTSFRLSSNVNKILEEEIEKEEKIT